MRKLGDAWGGSAWELDVSVPGEGRHGAESSSAFSTCFNIAESHMEWKKVFLQVLPLDTGGSLRLELHDTPPCMFSAQQESPRVRLRKYFITVNTGQRHWSLSEASLTDETFSYLHSLPLSSQVPRDKAIAVEFRDTNAHRK